ncbi:glycosyl transferase [Slackia faecicanis]|uniref:Glycosyl transferase n=1 Tax=Slackia faecicanis TaxID=255723 RepID=A0A3N0AGZ9_9ACTN|nr:biosynthetic peptidoglycan transglycosylase [Slackia faecicanis]RNL21296.1 glycosyl transferase [Slackia faecicanis]
MRRPAYTNDISKKNGFGRALRKLVKWFLILLLAFLMGTCAYFGIRGYTLYKQASERESVAQMAESIRANSAYIDLERLPQVYLDAVVSVEDHRFYQHPGFDVFATARALCNDIRAGAIVEGGSTITQQLAKNEFFTQEQVIERKVAEVLMAFDIERQLTKEDILELYVNSIYFGDGYYGIGSACAGYLGKAPAEMADWESVLLAGVPNAPSAYAPTLNFDLACQRQRHVLARMVKYGALKQEQADAIVAQTPAALPR